MEVNRKVVEEVDRFILNLGGNIDNRADNDKVRRELHQLLVNLEMECLTIYTFRENLKYIIDVKANTVSMAIRDGKL